MREIVKGNEILFILTGSIAIYKSCELISRLTRDGAIVDTIMTESATKLLSPTTVEALTGRRVRVKMFDEMGAMPHIELREGKGLLVICPATANIIAKVAIGIADDLASTTVLSFIGKKIVAPAMNSVMYEAPQTQKNLATLREHRFEIVEPSTGRLACGVEGVGRLAEIDSIYFAIERALYDRDDFKGKRVIVTSGATREDIDDVRFISNRSSGLMGKAIAEEVALRGAEVTYVYGQHETSLPLGCIDYIKVENSKDMLNHTKKQSKRADIVIMASAVSDFTVENRVKGKIKRTNGAVNIKLKPTVDILKSLSMDKKDGQVIVAFALETENILENAKKKLEEKGVDIVIANPAGIEGVGMGEQENIIYIITKKETIEKGRMDKYTCAREIVDFISDFMKDKRK